MRWIVLCALASACARRPAPPSPVARGHTTSAGADSALAGDAAPERAALPRPFATPSASHPAAVVERPRGAMLRAPSGWTVREWATLPGRVRQVTVASNGDVLATDSDGGTVLLLRDGDGDGRADAPAVYARGLNLPFALAIHREGWLYVANTNGVVRWRYRAGDTVAPGAASAVLPLPGLGYNQHWTRTIAFSIDGRTLFVSVGSETNVDAERDPRRAAITACAIDGTGCRIFASGLRNATGLAVEPASGALVAAVNERDELGDELPPDYLTRVREGAFYGWPYAYWGRNEDPRRAGERPDLVAQSVEPDLSLGAHAAPIAVIFPRALGGDALVSLHGSWNRAVPHGYEVWRVRFARGTPVQHSVFAHGWRLDRDRVWGRPAGMAEAPDGAIYVVDDGSRTLFKLTPPTASAPG